MRVAWQAFIAILTIAGIAYTALSFARTDDNGSYGFISHHVSDTESVVDSVEPRSAATRAGIRKGDIIWTRGTIEERVTTSTTEPGDRLHVRIGSPNAPEVAVVATQSTQTAPPALVFVLIATRFAFLAMGALIAWRRSDDPAARSLATFLSCFGLAISTSPDLAQIGPIWARILVDYAVEALYFIGAIAVLSFACRFPQPPTGGWRKVIARSVMPLAAFGLATSAGRLSLYFFTTFSQRWHLLLLVPYTLVYCLVLALTLASLIGSYVAMRGAERIRMRWVLGTFVLGFSGLIVYFAGLSLGSTSNVFQFSTMTIVAIPFGLAYVIFRHRIIDIGFVVNRAVVYGGVSLVVVGAFIVFEWVLSHIVESHSNASTLLQLGGALALGLSVRFIHERVDRYVDDLFFRERHLAEAAIRRFAHEAALITNPDDLVTKTVDIVVRNARLSFAAFYVRRGAEYAPLAASVDDLPPVDENDYGVLEMRTWHQGVDLSGSRSQLHAEIAFPMMVRGTLAGFLLCGSKTTHEALAPDERSALALLARDAGIALDSLRVRIIERELASLAREGGLPAALRDRLALLGATGGEGIAF